MEEGDEDLPEHLSIERAAEVLNRSQDMIIQARALRLPAQEEDDDPVPASELYDQLRTSRKFMDFTNFYEHTIQEIWRPLDAIMEGDKHRGANAHSTTMDHLLIYLIWLKHAPSYTLLAKICGMSTTRVEDNLNRVRPALYQSLYDRWWDNRSRPSFSPNSPLPPYGLIIDGHTTQIGKPSMDFRSTKVYWDGKNEMYGLKVELAVHASPPHYCMFVSDCVPASKHDYMLHKEIFGSYLEYLKMTPDELARRPGPGHAYWDILCDKGYVGSADDTEPIRRIYPTKGPHLTAAEVERNAHINKRRVVVEGFLGRLATLWGVFRVTWRFDQTHFDMDMAIACMLTNHHLESTALDFEDHDILKQLELMRNSRNQARREARAESARQSKRKKRYQAMLDLGLASSSHRRTTEYSTRH